MTVQEGGQVGPEYLDSGDPEWGEAPISGSGAFSGIDEYSPWGRWKERLYPSGTHPADTDALSLGRVGLEVAFKRLHVALFPEGGASPVGPDSIVQRTTAAMLAVHDALEWTHSLNEHYKQRYRKASDLDQSFGIYVEGALGARNASHHGMRRVVGYVDVPRSVYRAQGTRWVHTGTYRASEPDLQLRWVDALPPPLLNEPDQQLAFDTYLAGREVRNTFAAIIGFFHWAVDGNTPPGNLLHGASRDWPPIDVHSVSNRHQREGGPLGAVPVLPDDTASGTN